MLFGSELIPLHILSNACLAHELWEARQLPPEGGWERGWTTDAQCSAYTLKPVHPLVALPVIASMIHSCVNQYICADAAINSDHFQGKI